MNMNMTTETIKGRDGWRAETHIELNDSLFLDITTLKTFGGIRSRAQCYRKENGFITYVLFQDYSAVLATSKARCTEKAVSDLHRQTLGKLDEIKASVLAFYAAKGE